MPNMSPKKVPMPVLEPHVRNKTFQEVSLGYTPEQAKEEAERCLLCKNKPCVAGCPVNVDIPRFIAALKREDTEEAYDIITETNSLPAICGRVCPQENQCEGVCVRGIKGESVAIGRLERYAADCHLESGRKNTHQIEKNGIKVAVVGAGPAGLTCAGDLARLGYSVTVFEAFHTPGGVLTYGIPEFRLPKHIVAEEIEALKALGVEIMTNMVVGKVATLDELNEMGYKAVFIGSGAGLPQFMGIEGENLLGVYSANEFLTRINLMRAYDSDYDTPIKQSKRVAVIGGGNVTMDAARSAKRLGAKEVIIVYRRSEAELPARLEEVHHAKEEGIIFQLLTAPVRILGDEKGHVAAIECVEMTLGEPDESGRRRPIEKDGSNFKVETDSVIIAIGTNPNPLIAQMSQGLEVDKRGLITVNEDMLSSISGVYAGGDIITGAATVIMAMGAGKKAAAAIHKSLSQEGL